MHSTRSGRGAMLPSLNDGAHAVAVELLQIGRCLSAARHWTEAGGEPRPLFALAREADADGVAVAAQHVGSEVCRSLTRLGGDGEPDEARHGEHEQPAAPRIMLNLRFLRRIQLTLTRSSTQPAGVWLMARLDWFVLSLTLTCAALAVCLYW